jgi:hypothetical protein
MVDRNPLPDWSDIIAKRDDEITRLTARVEELEKALVVCDRVLHFDLRRMIEWGDDYNQAVKDAADAARAALTQPAQPAPSAWRPIETAPKDGTIFLATEGSAMVTTYWHPNQWKAVDWANPTHWMPLPPPPEKGGE